MTAPNETDDGIIDEPPEAVEERATSLSADRIRKLVEQAGCFPPRFIAYHNPPAPERTMHFLWVLRYRVAHTEMTGLKAIVGDPTKRQRASHWAGKKTDTNYQQIIQEIHDVYQPSETESSQIKFGRDLLTFMEYFEQRERYC